MSYFLIQIILKPLFLSLIFGFASLQECDIQGQSYVLSQASFMRINVNLDRWGV